MGKKVAVQGMTLEIVNGLPSPVEGTITILGSPSLYGKADRKGIYLDGLSISISNITSKTAPTPATIPDPVPKTSSINASSQAMRCDNGKKALRVNDTSSSISATPLIPGSPPVPYPVTFQVKITDANQNVVEAK